MSYFGGASSDNPGPLTGQNHNRSRFIRPIEHLSAMRARADETLLQRHPLYICAGVLALLSLILREPLLFMGALFVFALTIVPELWYRYGLRALVIERQLTTKRAAFGDIIEVALTVENRKVLPLPWLEVADEFPEGLVVLNRQLSASAKVKRLVLCSTLAMRAYQRVRRRYRLLAVERGIFQFGPTALRTSDPFGMLTREESRETAATLLVHPIVAPIERFGLPAAAPFGERKAARRILEDPLRISGIRDYVPGDEPRRIHWKATARTGTLQSKMYEPSTRHALVIFLDVRTLPKMLRGYDEDLAELLICAAASIANWAQQQGYAVGIYSNGTQGMIDSDLDAPREQLGVGNTPRLRILPSARPEQIAVILDGLARLQPFYGLPMEELIASERFHLPPGATVVYIGAEAIVDVPVILALRQLRAKEHTVSVLLAQSDPYAMDDDGALYLGNLRPHLIGGRALWNDLLRDVLGVELVNQLKKTKVPTFMGARMPHATDGNSGRSAGEDGHDNDIADTADIGGTPGGAGTPIRGSGAWAGQPRPLVVE